MIKQAFIRERKSLQKVCRVLVVSAALVGAPSVCGYQVQAQTAQTSGSVTMSGHIVDAESKETLIGATVYAPETQQGAYTNSYGFFSLTTKRSVKTLRISYIGYETKTITIDPSSREPLTIELKPQGTLEEVVVTEERRQLHAPQTGAISVPVHIIKTTPALLGENDLMKALQLMPGVQGGSEGSAGVHVRGGGADENLILLDGVSLYNVDHLLGFFSVFTPEAVKRVDLYKGNFPARFGGRLSSVIDVRTNDGNMQRYKGAVTIGLLSSKAQVEGPIIKDRTSFNVSMRRTYLDILAKPFIPQDHKGGYYFYDINTKLHHKFSSRDQLYFSLYHGRDRFFYGMEEYFSQRLPGSNDDDERTPLNFKVDTELHWGNTLGALRWNHVFSPKLYSDLTLSYTRYHFLFGVENDVTSRGKEVSYTKLDYKSGIQDFGLGWNAHYYATPKLEFRFGADYIRHQFKPESLGSNLRGEAGKDIEEVSVLLKNNRDEIAAHHAALYAESKAQVLGNVELNLGLRAALFAVDGKPYTSLQPRLAVDWRIRPGLNATVGYAKMVQNVHLLTSATMTLPTDLWVPATRYLEPMSSDQMTLGINYKFGAGWYMTLEGYYKKMNNILEYKDGSSFVGSSSGWENKVESGIGRSYGIEAILMKQTGRTTGWVGYTLSKSERQFPSGAINQGRWFPYKYDRRHKFNVVMSHKVTESIDLSASWEFYTGGVITLPYERMDVLRPDDASIPRYSYDSAGYIPERNNFRLPSTHRLNLSVNFSKRHGKTAESVFNVSVYNVYNAKNPAFVIPQDLVSRSESRPNRVTKFTMLPFIPSLSYTYKF